MTAALTPEELGDVGEDLFRTLCSQARLTANKSDRDRTGWDFRVEFPIAAAAGMTLDQRSPRACQIQIKTTAGESGSRVVAKLSAIERLAKDVAPAAVVVMRMRSDGSPITGYMIHLIGDELARVLRSLRRAEAKGRKDINRMSISFDYRRGRRFELTAEGLGQALSEVCEEDVAAYAERKRNQLANLGYEGGGIEAEALMWVESKDHLIKVLSGLAPMKPMQMRAFDRRFGIRVPYQGTLLDGIEEFPIELPGVGSCEIVIRNGPRRPAALFLCEASVPPPIDGAPLLVIRHDALTVLFKEDRLELQSNGAFSGDERDLEAWILLLRGLSYLASGTATIELEWRGIRMPPVVIPEGGLTGPHIDELPWLLEFVERWRETLSLAGVVPGSTFLLDDIWKARAAKMALDMMFSREPRARFEFDVIEGAEGEQSLDALYFNSVTFAGSTITFAVKVTLSRESASSMAFASSRFDMLDIRPGVTDLSAYGTELAAGNDIAVVIDPSNLTVDDR